MTKKIKIGNLKRFDVAEIWTAMTRSPSVWTSRCGRQYPFACRRAGRHCLCAGMTELARALAFRRRHEKALDASSLRLALPPFPVIAVLESASL
ncbi:MAG: hypothetical protein LBU11_02860 [Zoogloeaceae bacterium]|nr:hypothetical protein [Zoogloeaceae bacterium]